MNPLSDRLEIHQAFSAAFRGGGSWHGPGAEAQMVDAWSGSASAADRAVLAHCTGPTLDIGCGPGRMAEILAAQGQVVLGIDVVPEAVFQTRERGAAALLRDVFDQIPAEGRWETALLADGNIGIGGDPITLLRRVRETLNGEGRAVVDLAKCGIGIEIGSVRVETAGRVSEPFPWAVVGVDMAGFVAAEAGFEPPSIHQYGDRWFGVMQVAA